MKLIKQSKEFHVLRDKRVVRLEKKRFWPFSKYRVVIQHTGHVASSVAGPWESKEKACAAFARYDKMFGEYETFVPKY